MMTQPVQPAENPKGNFQVRSMVAKELPAETTYPLGEDEYKTLREGVSSDAKSGLYFCLGLCASALVGLVSLYANADWPSFWARQRGTLLVLFGILLFIFAASVTGCCVFYRLLRREDSPCSRLKVRIERHFKDSLGGGQS
jgi:hypothetical protein